MANLWKLLFAALLLQSCNNAAVDSGGEKPALQLSYHNASGENFRMLDVEIFGKAYHFSNVGSGSGTPFVEVEKSYPYHFARVVTSIDTLVSQPVDFVGEQLLSAGRHTLTLDIDTLQTGERVLVFKNMKQPTPAGDHHTRPSDVLDNLFIALNKKDWKVVNSFYASNAVITDIANDPANGSPSDYFSKLFESNEIYYIYLHRQEPTNNGIRVQAFTRRGARSAEYPLCFNFVINNNRVTEQHAIACEE